jgi:hypothetical protein
MGRIVKLLLLVVCLLGGAGVVSFAGAFIKMKSYIGDNLPALGSRDWALVPKAEQIDGNPTVWKFQYANTEIQGLKSITVFVSLTGSIERTIPVNLSARLEPHRRRMP